MKKLLFLLIILMMPTMYVFANFKTVINSSVPVFNYADFTIAEVDNIELENKFIALSEIKFNNNDNINSFTENEPYNISVQYPETKSEHINKELNKLATKLIKDFKKDALKYKNKSKEILKEIPKLNINFTVYEYNQNIVSFKYKLERFISEENTIDEIQTTTFDLRTDKNIKLEDNILSKKENMDEVAKIIQNKITENKLLGSKYNYSKIGEMIKPENKTFEKFILDENNLVFLFTNKQLGIDDSTEIIEVEIPILFLVSLFKIDIKELDLFYEKSDPTKYIDENGEEKSYKYIALTFDDGPHAKNTAYLLNELEARNVKATFFILGNRISGNTSIVQKMIDDKHEIGGHTFNHKELNKLNSKQINKEITDTNTELFEYFGIKTTVFRPPYGSVNKNVIQIIKDYNMPIILWNVDPLDWKYQDAQRVSKHIIQKAQNGDIILLHDMFKSSAEAAIIVVDELTKKGFKFLTVTELLSLQGEVLSGTSYSKSNIPKE